MKGKLKPTDPVDVGVLVHPDPPLTEKQLSLLIKASEMGYFEDPRQAHTSDLGEFFNMHPDALSIQLRRAKYRVLNAYADAMGGFEEIEPWIDAEDDSADSEGLDSIAEGVGVVEEARR